MANLAGERGRVLAQGRITNNRDAVLPTRRNTEAPAVAIRADMRAATRGDGGADELRRTLDQFTDGVAAVGNARIAADTEGFRRDAAAGALDSQTGTEIDPARARSLAYSEAFYSARAEKRFNDFSLETKQAVEEALNQGMGPDEVHALVLDRVKGFSSDVMETIPTATAQRATAGRLSAMGAELDAAITTRITERTREEFVTTAQGNIQTSLRAGQPVTFEAYVAQFRQGGLAPADAKKAAIDAVAAVALDRDDPNPDLLDGLLNSTQADGKTPSLSAAEQLQIEDRITQANSLKTQVEREQHEDRVDTLLEGWTTRALDGEIVDEDITKAFADGYLKPQEVAQYLGLMNNLRDAIEDGHLDEDFNLDVQERIALGRPPSNDQIMAWQREGRFGTGRAARTAAIQALGSAAAGRRVGRGDGEGSSATGLTAKQARSQNVTLAREYLMGGLNPGEDATPFERQMRTRAGMEFNWRVAAGDDPMNAATNLYTAFSQRMAQGPRPRASQPAASAGNTVRYDSNGNRIR